MKPATPHRPSTIAAPAWVLRRVLAFTDVTAVTLAWAMAMAMVWFGDPGSRRAAMLGGWLLLAVAVTAAVLSREELYRTRVLAIRAVEVQRLGRTSLIAAVVLAVADRVLGSPLGLPLVGVGSLSSYALLLVSRGAFQMWVYEARRRRADGRCLLVVGHPHVARRTLDLLQGRPELGYRLVGYVAAQRSPVELGVPWLGTPVDLGLLTQLTAVGSVVVVAGALEPDILTDTVAELRALDVYVHLAIDDGEHAPDIRILPLLDRTPPADEPALSSWQRIGKRAFDVIAGAVLTVVAAPVVIVAAALLKIVAGGPVLVRDGRLGPHGEPITVTRLRTSDLPPTRRARLIGRVCRRLCIDELPQLGNVLAGSMSLVGPRPRRPSGVERIDEAPTGMSAGLIGLRHVEVRDYPEYGPYRRLDHFYAEHWSIGLDMSIVAASATHVLCRTAREGLRGDEHAVVG